MFELFELARLIDQAQLNVIGQKHDIAHQLYSAMVDGAVKNDDDGQTLFYPDSRRGQDQFTELRKKLRPRLINSVLSNEDLHKGYWKRYYRSYKQMLVSDLLWNRGKAAAAAQIAEETCKMAKKYHFTKLAAVAARRLTYHYALVSPDTRRYQRYRLITEEQEHILHWENKAYDRYHEIGLHLRTAKTITPELIHVAQRYTDELRPGEAKIRTIDFQQMRHSVELMLHLMQNNAQGVIDTGRRAMAFFAKLAFKAPGGVARSFQIYMLPAFLQSGQYAEARAMLEELKAGTHTGSANWISIHQLEAILGFYTEDLDLVRSALAAIRKSKLHSLIREEMQIYQLYLDLLSGKKEFKLGRFMNEVPGYTADKKGMNINILILQYLISLQREDRPAIIQRMEALQSYAYRHLKGDPTLRRSELFFRLLYLLARSAFDMEEVEQRSPGLFGQLQDTPQQISAVDVEVVPYEAIWDWVRRVLA